jgi:hypothetical protein
MRTKKHAEPKMLRKGFLSLLIQEPVPTSPKRITIVRNIKKLISDVDIPEKF